MPELDRRYRCATCRAGFESQEQLDAHVWKEHRQRPPPPQEPKEVPAQPGR